MKSIEANVRMKLHNYVHLVNQNNEICIYGVKAEHERLESNQHFELNNINTCRTLIQNIETKRSVVKYLQD